MEKFNLLALSNVLAGFGIRERYYLVLPEDLNNIPNSCCEYITALVKKTKTRYQCDKKEFIRLIKDKLVDKDLVDDFCNRIESYCISYLMIKAGFIIKADLHNKDCDKYSFVTSIIDFNDLTLSITFNRNIYLIRYGDDDPSRIYVDIDNLSSFFSNCDCEDKEEKVEKDNPICIFCSKTSYGNYRCGVLVYVDYAGKFKDVTSRDNFSSIKNYLSDEEIKKITEKLGCDVGTLDTILTDSYVSINYKDIEHVYSEENRKPETGDVIGYKLTRAFSPTDIVLEDYKACDLKIDRDFSWSTYREVIDNGKTFKKFPACRGLINN